MQEITIVAKNSVGTLAAVAEALGNVGVNIEAISAYERNDRAVFRVVTNDISTALKTLSRLPDVEYTSSGILVLAMPNRPGELGKITRKLANRDVGIESLYIISRLPDRTEVAIKPAEKDFEKAKEALRIK